MDNILRSSAILALSTLVLLLGTGCESTRIAKDYDAPVKQALARGGDAVVELLIEVNRDGKAKVLDVTGVSPGTRASDIDIAYDLVAMTTYPPPRVPADSYQSKTLMNLARIANKGDSLTKNPARESAFLERRDQKLLRRQLSTPVPREMIGSGHEARN
jgi:hypothetical protein